jgi:flagellar hook protein FlgE
MTSQPFAQSSPLNLQNQEQAMFNSFSAALSALKSHSAAVDAVGHNLANLNTSGFKATEVAFKDIVSESMSSRTEVGLGTSRTITLRNFSQGAVQTTSGPLDAAIQGNGFFVVRDANNQRLLTRDGSFQLDTNGYVVTLTGERVQSYDAGVLSDIQMPAGASPASPTTEFSLTANLNATAAENDTLSTPIEMVDSLGVTHTVTVTFTKAAAAGTWDYSFSVPGGTSATTGSIVFDNAGALQTPDLAGGIIDVPVTALSSGAQDLDLKWHLYDNAGAPLLTQFAQPSAASATKQDGYPAAEVASVGMEDGGKIIARYGNGTSREVGVLAIALVANPTSLIAAGGNMFRTSTETSPPTWATSGAGGRGKVKAGAVEASTVDMAREFTNLIVYQRGYQANSRVITTADELSQETLNLKR